MKVVLYNIYFQSFFKDVCDSIWSLSSSLSFDVLDCPLQVDLNADNDTICLGECTDLNVSVTGGDASTYIILGLQYFQIILDHIMFVQL